MEASGAFAVEFVRVPVPALVGDEEQSSVRAPFGLEDGDVPCSGHSLPRGHAPPRVELAHPEFRAVPRHVRVVPFEPRDSLAVGTESGGGVEVAIRSDHPSVLAAVRIHADDAVPRFIVALRLLDDDDPAPAGIDLRGGVARSVVRGQSARPTVGIESVESLIFELHVVHRAVAGREGASAVLVDTGSRVLGRRQEFAIPVRVEDDEGGPAALGRA